MIRRLLHRWATGVAGVLATSIPTVDMLDVYVNTWWADWLDGLWTIVACALLVWLVAWLRASSDRTHAKLLTAREEIEAYRG